MSDDVERLSASGIKKYRDCPKQFWYKYVSVVEPPEEGEIEHFQVGNAVHDSLENVLQEVDNINTLSERGILEKLREEERSLDYNYNDSGKVQTCLEFAAKYISKYVTNIVSVEDEFNMNVSGVDFIGYADLVADIEYGGEEFEDVIIDWKTGKETEEWKERVQGGMYAKMLNEEVGRWPDSIHFVYLNQDTLSKHNRIVDGEVLWNDYQNTYWEEIEGDISDISNSAFNEEWEANVTDDCVWCDYKYACSDYVGSEEAEQHQLEVEGQI